MRKYNALHGALQLKYFYNALCIKAVSELLPKCLKCPPAKQIT